MQNRAEKAVELHAKGYNCCQAVVCAYCDLFGIDEKTAFTLSEGFGAGMGGMENTCGAVSGMVMLAGMKKSCRDPELRNTKAVTYPVVKTMTKAFKDQNTTTICRELKGLDTGTVLRGCRDCIMDACHIVDANLLND